MKEVKDVFEASKILGEVRKHILHSDMENRIDLSDGLLSVMDYLCGSELITKLYRAD